MRLRKKHLQISSKRNSYVLYSFFEKQQEGPAKVASFRLLAFILNELACGHTLESRYENHPLQGKYAGCFECHVRGDLLLVYEIDAPNDIVSVVDIGSHSELFG